MKIAISSTGKTLECMIDPRFGRCQYFIYADPETLQFEVVDNNSAIAGGGAGIAAAQAISVKGADAILTGNCGPNAYQVLTAAGIKVITGVTGKVNDAIQDYKDGKYQASSQPSVSDHFGMGGRGMGRGGGGRGLGYGRDTGRS
jgi:predicted Fe-Mo cluster-binding NifX family protein